MLERSDHYVPVPHVILPDKINDGESRQLCWSPPTFHKCNLVIHLQVPKAWHSLGKFDVLSDHVLQKLDTLAKEHGLFTGFWLYVLQVLVELIMRHHCQGVQQVLLWATLLLRKAKTVITRKKGMIRRKTGDEGEEERKKREEDFGRGRRQKRGRSSQPESV